MSANDAQMEIRKIIREIEEKSANADYIYRGEPECFARVSSSLWRQFQKKSEDEQFDMELIDIDFVQDKILDAAESYARGADTGFEMMAQLQHFGGKTNLIDFATDYLKALFFACDGSHLKDGRIILLQKTDEANKEYQIKEPLNPQNRVIAQKSIFVRPPKGYIQPDQYDEVKIIKSLKHPMLNHLRKYHGISTATMYNDLHGFIINQEIHEKAYIEYYRGLSYQQVGASENEDTNGKSEL